MGQDEDRGLHTCRFEAAEHSGRLVVGERARRQHQRAAQDVEGDHPWEQEVDRSPGSRVHGRGRNGDALNLAQHPLVVRGDGALEQREARFTGRAGSVDDFQPDRDQPPGAVVLPKIVRDGEFNVSL